MLEEGLFYNFKINIEYISVDVNLPKIITLKSLIKWWSWAEADTRGRREEERGAAQPARAIPPPPPSFPRFFVQVNFFFLNN